MNNTNEKFQITIEIDTTDLQLGIMAHQVVVDLLQPEFESAVLSAAGRFQALRRKTKGGGRAKSVICGQCREELATTAKLREHRREGCRS